MQLHACNYMPYMLYCLITCIIIWHYIHKYMLSWSITCTMLCLSITSITMITCHFDRRAQSAFLLLLDLFWWIISQRAVIGVSYLLYVSGVEEAEIMRSLTPCTVPDEVKPCRWWGRLRWAVIGMSRMWVWYFQSILPNSKSLSARSNTELIGKKVRWQL